MERIINIMNKMKLDVVIITDGYNMHYLTGYTGHTGCMLIFSKEQYILTDSRYTEQVGIETEGIKCIDIGLDGYATTICRLMSNYFEKEINSVDKVIHIGFENNHISYREYKAFADEFEKHFGDRAVMCELKDRVSELRMVKDDAEIKYISKAESIGDEAFTHILEYIKPGMTEKDIALELEYTMKKLGADGLSFDTIVASGHNSSLPHAVPTERRIEDGDFVTMDFGCIYKGYCSDMTRTVFIGREVDECKKRVYDIVLNSQMQSMKLIKSGVRCSDIDAVARKIITDAGYGDYFGHGLGHSVGLYIHEEPRFSAKCDTILKEGMVLTVEPGIYLPGRFGVRIEDVVVVTKDGCRNLTNSTKELQCIM